MVGCFQPSAGRVDKLLTVPVNLKHYVELNVEDSFSVSTLQQRMDRHLASNWKEPARSVKAKLHVIQTGLLLTPVSWWPYRRVNLAEFRQINRLVTFHLADCHFAVGLFDPDFSEKAYVIMATKIDGDLNQLIRMVEPHIITMRNVDSEVMRKLIHSSRSTLLRHSYNFAQSLVLPGSGHRLKASSRDAAVDPISGVRVPPVCTCGTTSFAGRNQSSAASAVPSTSRKSEIKIKEDKHKDNMHETITNLDETHALVSTATRKYAREMTDETGKHWEVDMKYVRFDPLLGNVLDNECGSVYLYTAREVLSRE